MGPNDQYSYYYNQSNAQPQNNYLSYHQQSTPVTAAAAASNYQQHSRATSGSTSTYPNYQQRQTQAQSHSTPQWYTSTATDGTSQRGAAEALSRMGSNDRASTDRTTVQNSYPSGNSAYSTTNNQVPVSASYNNASATTAQYSNYNPSQTRAPSHGHIQQQQQQQQPRPSSVNSVRSAGIAPQRSPIVENVTRPNSAQMQQQQQHSYQQQRVGQVANASAVRAASPAQIQASRHLQSLQQSDQRTTATTAATQQYSGYEQTQQNGTSQMNQSTVDPSAVYDPWPEYQRKLEASRKEREAQEAKEAAEKAIRDAEDKRKEVEAKAKAEEEQRAADELKQAEDERKKEEKKLADTAKRKANRQGRKEKGKEKAKAIPSAEPNDSAYTPQPDITELSKGAAPSDNPEAQIKALMAMVKTMNDKHPSLLAKIWEQERQDHLQKTTSLSPVVDRQVSQPGASAGAPEPSTAKQSKVLYSCDPCHKQKAKCDRQKPCSRCITSKKEDGCTYNNAERRRWKAQSTSSSKKVSPRAIDANAPPQKPPQPTPNQLPSGTPTSAQPQPQTQSTHIAHKPAQNPIQKPANSGTIWPKEKKGQLAASAAAWLNAIAENHTNQILPTKIGQFLDQNPTYIELCELLEAEGLKLERAAFARALLQCVPEVPKPNTEGAKPPKVAASVIALPIPNQQPVASHPIPLNVPPPAIPPPIQHYSNGSWIAPSAENVPPNTSYKRPYFKPNPSTTFVPKNSEPPKSTSLPAEPASKQDAARKRTFADIVDLTALSDEDELPPQQKPRREYEYAPAPVVSKPGEAYQPPPKYNYLSGFTGLVPPYLQQSLQQQNSHQQQNPHQQHANYPNRPQPQAQPQSQPPSRLIDEDRLRGAELVQPLSREKALKRNSYDPRTLARDILLATGKHPEMAPLNNRLEPLRQAFTGANQITINADLSTLRWDLLDPGEPIPLVAVDDDRDSVLNDAEDDADADDESENERYHARVQANANRIVIGVDGHTSGQVMVQPLATTPLRKDGFPAKRRGRPKGWRKSAPGDIQTRPLGFGEDHQSSGQPSRSVPRQQTSHPSNPNRGTPGQSTPSGSRPPPDTPQSAPGGGAGYSQFTRVDENGNPVKKKGRPVGWRKSLHQKGIGALAGGSGPGPSKSVRNNNIKGAPSKPDVKYAVYKCMWKDCQAELHNLDTLRKHLNKLHGKIDDKGRYTCKWDGCGKKVQTVDQQTGEVKTVLQYHYFPDFDLWKDHVEKIHVVPMAWKLGDGPPGGVSDSGATDSEAYLSDAHGRQVTPRISAPASASASGATPSSALRLGLPQRGRPPKSTPEQKAREKEAEIAKRKKEIGVGMDRGGARLANDKRRAGFVDDDEEESVVENEDD
ncbi:hypothetical protein EJ08DRAFT_678642 [Tothia fuscella]|uniref:Zn(2)-C6 fungal-type domain-containing protein n=1 Tax=Tothia fuscella TaxID=1048955 RepID=A0A9P4TZM4_9PEZI|nr:hypothetical protein EJ08DRAFT_678642 [Tothia fuscella]